MTYVYNVAVKRSDEKVETDTVYSEKLMTEEDADGMSTLVGAAVLLSLVGTFRPANEERQRKNCFLSNKGVEKDEVS